MSNNKNEIGCIFVKHGNYGEYLSIKVEIDGVTHNLTAFLSKYYEEGGKKPKYYIPAPKIESNEQKQNVTFNAQPIYQQPKSPIKSNSDDDKFPF